MDFVGAQCCMEMKKYAEASLWSDLGLAVSFLQTSLFCTIHSSKNLLLVEEKWLAVESEQL